MDLTTGTLINVKAEHRPYDESIMPCPYLIFDIETHEAVCIVHNALGILGKYYCTGYPLVPEDIIPGCGFSFVMEYEGILSCVKEA